MAVFEAIRQSQYMSLKILLRLGFNPNEDVGGISPLSLCVTHQHQRFKLQSARLLLEYNADPRLVALEPVGIKFLNVEKLNRTLLYLQTWI
jgi:hypothetical protein